MAATTSRRIAPRSPSARRPSPVVAAPVQAPAPTPAGCGWHTLMSDGGNTIEMELHLPFSLDKDQRANIRVMWLEGDRSSSATRGGPEEMTGVPVYALDDLVENLSSLLALARLNGLLPPRE